MEHKTTKYNHSKNYEYSTFINAKQLRKKENTTEAEKLLWYYIKNKQLNNCKFRRQVPIGNFVVDFLCIEKKLIIELDGGQHNEDNNIKYDNTRTECLRGLGYNVVRFWNNEVFQNMENVLETIYKYLK